MCYHSVLDRTQNHRHHIEVHYRRVFSSGNTSTNTWSMQSYRRASYRHRSQTLSSMCSMIPLPHMLYEIQFKRHLINCQVDCISPPVPDGYNGWMGGPKSDSRIYSEHQSEYLQRTHFSFSISLNFAVFLCFSQLVTKTPMYGKINIPCVMSLSPAASLLIFCNKFVKI